MSLDRKIRVGVLFGGRSSEHEVSLMSTRSVINALSPEKYEIIPIGITHKGVWLSGEDALEAFEFSNTKNLTEVSLIPGSLSRMLYKVTQAQAGNIQLEALSQLDVVFPVLHGTFGEDGTIQGLLEMSGIPYVGAGVLASSVCMDKALFKEVMRANNLPVLPSLTITTDQITKDKEATLDRIEAFLNYPIFIKPANGGSSVGTSKCRSRSDLLEGLLEALQYDRRVLVEKGLSAREIEVSVLGNTNPRASLPGEIIPAAEFYSYEAKYHDENTQLVIPAHLPEEVVAKIQALAVKAYIAVDCAGMARVDFLIDRASNELYISETNTIPGFTKISMYPKLWAVSGLPYPALLDSLIELALERKEEIDRLQRLYRRSA
ncbi:MAG: D-alanine--D-alanine ligase [Anaerolineaceae bacterium]|nr:D-alanine--D-alanine ligase [Anaerolineaceae bacterium]